MAPYIDRPEQSQQQGLAMLHQCVQQPEPETDENIDRKKDLMMPFPSSETESFCQNYAFPLKTTRSGAKEQIKCMRRKQFQCYLKRIKKLARKRYASEMIRNRGSSSIRGSSTRSSTFEVLRNVVKILQMDQQEKGRLIANDDQLATVYKGTNLTEIAQPLPSLIPLSKVQAIQLINEKEEMVEKPSSPANSSCTGTTTSLGQSSTDGTISAVVGTELDNMALNNDYQSQRDYLLQDKNSTTSQMTNESKTTITTQNSTTSGGRFLGTLVIILPEGTVLRCEDSPRSPTFEGIPLSNIVKCGQSLLPLLHDKGAETLLRNAFGGHPWIRRMYARLTWGKTEAVRPCDFLCEFSVDQENETRRIASIQVFCLERIFSTISTILNGKKHTHENLIRPASSGISFTTRHNVTCSIIYLDSASIPWLGHFPSEITGKSLFALVHPDDIEFVKRVHKQLHKSGGNQIVSTPNLRLVTYSGNVIYVNSEWAAFVNPWTNLIEMVVARHSVALNNNDNNNNNKWSHVDEQENYSADSSKENCTDRSIENKIGVCDKPRKHDAEIYGILSKPVTCFAQVPKVQINQFGEVGALCQKQELKPPQTIDRTSQQVLLQHKNNLQIASQLLSTNQQREQQFLAHKQIIGMNSASNAQTTAKIPPYSINIPSSQQQMHFEKPTSPCLSYNQINILENVHRLFLSQSQPIENAGQIYHNDPQVEGNFTSGDVLLKNEAKQQQCDRSKFLYMPLEANNDRLESAIMLTKSSLQKHDQRCEQECKNNWRQRLSLKRMAQDQQTLSAQSSPQPSKVSKTDVSGTIGGHQNSDLSIQQPNKQQFDGIPATVNPILAQKLWMNYWLGSICAHFQQSIGPSDSPMMSNMNQRDGTNFQTQESFFDRLKAYRNGADQATTYLLRQQHGQESLQNFTVLERPQQIQ